MVNGEANTCCPAPFDDSFVLPTTGAAPRVARRAGFLFYSRGNGRTLF